MWLQDLAPSPISEMASSDRRQIAAVGNHVPYLPVSFVTRWRLQSSFPCGSRLCLYTLAASRLLFGLSCTSLPSASPSWDGREERRVAGELERQGGRALLCVCPAVGRVDEVRSLPTPRHHLASLGLVTFPGMLVSDLFGPC